MLKPYTLLFTLLLCTSSWAGIEYKGTTPADLEKMQQEALSAPGATSREEYGYIKVSVPAKHTFYYFTTPSHPCHPAVVIQTVYEENGAIWIKAHGLTAGDRDLFEQWLSGFEQQQKRIQASLNAKR